MNLHQTKQDILEAGRRLYDKGYVVSNDGNISARISDDRIITTPTGLCKGTLIAVNGMTEPDSGSDAFSMTRRLNCCASRPSVRPVQARTSSRLRT